MAETTGSTIRPPWLKEDGTPTATPPPKPAGPVANGNLDAPPLQDATTGRFLPGNAGRREGSRNRVTIRMENILESEAEAITRKCVEKAKRGDTDCIKLIFSRLCPPMKGRPLGPFAKREGEGSVDAILRAVLEGEVSASEGQEAISLIQSAVAIEVARKTKEIREHQLENLKAMTAKVVNGNEVRGGVMLVPLVDDVDSWEEFAQSTQRDLKKRVKE